MKEECFVLLVCYKQAAPLTEQARSLFLHGVRRHLHVDSRRTKTLSRRWAVGLPESDGVDGPGVNPGLRPWDYRRRNRRLCGVHRGDGPGAALLRGVVTPLLRLCLAP